MFPYRAASLARRVVMAAAVCLLLLLVCLTRVYIANGEEPRRQPRRLTHGMHRTFEADRVCYDVQIFTQRNEAAKVTVKPLAPQNKTGVNETSLIGVMLVLLIISTVISLADVLKVKRNRNAPGSDADERCSLAEFANMKRPRRDSSADSSHSNSGKVAGLLRFDSVGSAFARMRTDSLSNAGLPGLDTPNTPPTGPRNSLKLLGARPTPMLRRSSFPALSLFDGMDPQRRRMSIDSEGDSSPDTGRRRIRIIRRH